MTDRLAGLFDSAVGMLPISEARSLELFTEITHYDDAACDAWIGRIRCGDTDRVTLFRAWYSRTRFGQLAGASHLPMHTLGARVPIGGLYGDIAYPVTSPMAITMGFAASEASHGNFADAMEAIENVQTGERARNMGIDPQTHRIYLASAKFGEVPAESTATNPRRRPPMIPGSFTIIVVEPVGSH